MHNATVTIAYRGRTLTFSLSGDELSRTGGKPYLNNASRDYIADEVERALCELTSHVIESEITVCPSEERE